MKKFTKVLAVLLAVAVLQPHLRLALRTAAHHPRLK